MDFKNLETILSYLTITCDLHKAIQLEDKNAILRHSFNHKRERERERERDRQTDRQTDRAN